MFETENVSQSSLFSLCKFHTPFYHQTITGLTLSGEMDEKCCKGVMILIYGYELVSHVPGIPAWLDRACDVKAAGLIIRPGSEENMITDYLIHECKKRNLILGELFPPATFRELICSFYSHMASPCSGEICSYEDVYLRLQSSISSCCPDQLLKELHYWTGCQAALVAGQDTYVYPRAPMLDPELFHPVCWRKEASLSPYASIRYYTASQPPVHILQTDLLRNNLPTGMLFLIKKEEDFKKNDQWLLNHAALLCAGLSHLNRRSGQMDDLFASIRSDTPLDETSMALLPQEGHALWFSEFHISGATPDLTGTEEYLSYLIHYHFPRELCYSFRGHELLVFISTMDVENFARKLSSLLNRARRQYHVGISRKYSRSQISIAFSEAGHAAKMAGLLDYGQEPCFFHELGIYRLFSYPENSWAVDQMLGEMNSLLDDMDLEKKNILTLTVRTFIKNNFNYQKTADDLYTHVNTIRYRIRQLEELWNADLSSTEGRLLFNVLAKLLPLWMQGPPD